MNESRDSPHGHQGVITTSFHFGLDRVDPREMAAPREPADLQRDLLVLRVRHGAVVDDADDGDEDGPPLFLDSLEERLQPAHVALAVGVEEHEDVARGRSGAA